VLLEVGDGVGVRLDALVFFGFLAGVKELKEAWGALGVCPDVDLDDFAFLYVFQYGLVGKKD
jgi:hypothetical protein